MVWTACREDWDEGFVCDARANSDSNIVVACDATRAAGHTWDLGRQAGEVKRGVTHQDDHVTSNQGNREDGSLLSLNRALERLGERVREELEAVRFHVLVEGNIVSFAVVGDRGDRCEVPLVWCEQLLVFFHLTVVNHGGWC